jgi:hypothetical protein
VRPSLSPTMWTSRSDSRGSTWRPLSRGSFPMYALGSTGVTTASGVTLFGGRFPSLAVQVRTRAAYFHSRISSTAIHRDSLYKAERSEP